MKRLSFSLLWVLITIILVAILLFPVYQATGENYQFYLPNAVAIVVAITLTRYLFLLDYHWFGDINWLKVVLAFAVIPVALFVIDSHYEFQRFLDEDGIHSILLDGKSSAITGYIRNQFILFWAWALIACIAIPIKMIRSIWRSYKAKIK